VVSFDYQLDFRLNRWYSTILIDPVRSFGQKKFEKFFLPWDSLDKKQNNIFADYIVIIFKDRLLTGLTFFSIFAKLKFEHSVLN